jgi:hypothetical protein
MESESGSDAFKRWLEGLTEEEYAAFQQERQERMKDTRRSFDEISIITKEVENPWLVNHA